ncbi:PstS family phosphate ABC transporter substrate-binding protein [Photobacterium leiognathi]|uniref:Phosphate ABC transporter substrate-binding protein n=1 Tax=Photobacterium leiognathi TaxID=553611 RepID=A0A2T3MGC6_PHOLE|nr:substrate-binding domain-containing protein [Photobacterium leiognathi]KJF98857.1 phosphate ABC transporter substrate-binding protein [Photobacterium leiognathi]PSV93223.1 phosphate ABC transporter substrate-binding protein [Photobacterium leiognathi]
MNKSTFTYMLPLALFAASAYADSHKTIAVENELNTVVNELLSTATLNNQLLTEQSNDIQKVMIEDGVKIGISSRRWLDSEVAVFKDKYGYKPTELYFTSDAVAILVNEDNPIKSISINALADIFGCKSSLEPVQWQSVNPILANHSELAQVQAYSVNGDLSAHRNFTKMITCYAGQKTATKSLSNRDDLIDTIESKENAIGYTVYQSQDKDIKRIDIIDKNGESFGLDHETILSGRYPLANVYYMYLNLEPTNSSLSSQQTDFVNYVMTPEAQQTLVKNGFIGLPPAAIERNKVVLKQQQPEIQGGYK